MSLTLVVASVGWLARAALAQEAAGTASIHGQISNLATRANLDGARVRVVGSEREVVSDHDGSYTLDGLKPGSYTLAVEYPGLDEQRINVEVGAGAQVQQDVKLTSQVYVLEKFTVAGEREGNAAAIVAQRNAVNVANVITADAFGNIAKGNVGNFLKRLPGIAGTTDEVETENIVLRGMAANFTSLDIDGARATSGGSGRAQSAAAIPADMIERVEVVKALTPDLDADSIGGRVNLVTKSAYDRQGRAISLRLADSYSFTYGTKVARQKDSSLAPSVAASYSDVFSVGGGVRNLGVYVSGNWERILDIRGTTSWNENYGSPNGSSSEGPSIWTRFNNASTAIHGLDRGGAAFKVDYRYSRDLSLGASATFSTYTNTMFRSRNQLKNGTVRPGPSGNDPFSYFMVIDGANYGTERSIRDRVDDTVTGRLYAKYKNAAGWRVDGNFSASRTRRHESTQTHNFTSNKKIDYVLDRREGYADPRWPAIRVYGAPYTGTTHVTTAAPTTFLDINPFGDNFSDVSSTSDGQWQRIFSKNELIKSTVDVTKAIPTRWPIEIKGGLSYRAQLVDTSRDDLRGKISVTGYGRDLSRLLDDTWDLRGAIGRYPAGSVLDIGKITNAMGISYAGPADDPIARWNYNPSVFTINTSSTRQNTLANTRRVWEHVYGTYLQGSIHIGRLDILTGARIEQTENIRNQVQRDRKVAGTLGEWTGRTWGTADYRNVYPSVHLKYRVSPNLMAKASYSTSSGRPDWGELLGTADSDPVNHTLDVPNLNLKPRSSRNVDLSLEYYFEPVGVVSAGVFQKQIRDFDVNASWEVSAAEAAELGANPTPGDNTPWEVSSKLNAGEGRVRGIELNYSQQLSNLLPGFLRGVGVFANYTYLQTEGTFDNGEVGSPVIKRDRLEKFIPRSANAGVSYVYNRYDLRVSWNYTGAWDENTDLNNPDRTKVRGERWQLDFTGKFKATKNITLFADLINLTSNHGLKYRGYVDPARRNETNALGFLLTAGVQANF